MEIRNVKCEFVDRPDDERCATRRAAGVQAVDIVAPGLKCHTTRGTITLVIVRNVVNGATEAVNGVHSLAPVPREDAHASVE